MQHVFDYSNNARQKMSNRTGESSSELCAYNPLRASTTDMEVVLQDSVSIGVHNSTIVRS